MLMASSEWSMETRAKSQTLATGGIATQAMPHGFCAKL
ncbi:hypothetical protein L8106_02702 [Lyngbya sp. PCC 8106]|nr:hypothetical protein L8106_02702 [Lyngbya sp. PCC 8106]